MSSQPWKLNKDKFLTRIKELLDADYISIKIVDGSITLEFVNIGRPLIEDEESWVEATIENGQIKVTHFWGDEGVLAEILDGRPLADEEIDAELTAISEGMKQQKKEFERGRFP